MSTDIIDGAAIAADVTKLMNSGFGEIEARAMATGRARERAMIAEARGELPPIELVDTEAAEIHEALRARPEDYDRWAIQPEDSSRAAADAAAEATRAVRDVGLALDIGPGTAEFLAQRIDEGAKAAHAMSEDEHHAHVREGMLQLIDRYGEKEAKQLVADATAALRYAKADERIVSAFIVGASTDRYVLELLASRYRAMKD